MDAQTHVAAEQGGWAIDAVDLVLGWIDRSRQRGDLARVDPALLKDIGISPAQASAECRKHFWQQ